MNLPPFGAPPAEIPMVLDGTRPQDWSGTEAEWTTFFDTFVADIRANIWPAWDMATHQWDGPATAFAEAMTRAELQIMIDHIQTPGVLDQTPNTPNYGGDAPARDHYWHFAIEDFIGDKFIKSLPTRFPAKYPPALPVELEMAAFALRNVGYYDETLDLAEIDKLFGRMFRNKYNGIFQTKMIFRRPRPQQAAFILGLYDFVWRQAAGNVHTGNHPALISGHCAQGLLIMCTLVDEKLAAGTAEADIRLEDYAQYAVDFGDRRVFGAVHYPTDNIASWVAALRMIPWVFPERGERLVAFIRDALTRKSALYRIIADTFPGNPDLQPAWDLLQAEMGDTPG